jgi:hypothetical protein
MVPHLSCDCTQSPCFGSVLCAKMEGGRESNLVNVCQRQQTTLDSFLKPRDAPAPPTLLEDTGEAGSDDEAAMVRCSMGSM